MNNPNYALVLEKLPNSFEPIFLFDDLLKLDAFTKKFTKEELCTYLKDNHYIENINDANYLTIIFNNNGIRRVKEGLYTKDIATADILSYIKSFLIAYQNNCELLNELFQYLNNKKTINAHTKLLLKELIISRKVDSNYNLLLNELNSLPYYDLRTIYLYIIKNLQLKINDNKETHRLIKNNKIIAA
jgi:hypothetical protein